MSESADNTPNRPLVPIVDGFGELTNPTISNNPLFAPGAGVPHYHTRTRVRDGSLPQVPPNIGSVYPPYGRRPSRPPLSPQERQRVEEINAILNQQLAKEEELVSNLTSVETELDRARRQIKLGLQETEAIKREQQEELKQILGEEDGDSSELALQVEELKQDLQTVAGRVDSVVGRLDSLEQNLTSRLDQMLQLFLGNSKADSEAPSQSTEPPANPEPQPSRLLLPHQQVALALSKRPQQDSDFKAPLATYKAEASGAMVTPESFMTATSGLGTGPRPEPVDMAIARVSMWSQNRNALAVPQEQSSAPISHHPQWPAGDLALAGRDRNFDPPRLSGQGGGYSNSPNSPGNLTFGLVPPNLHTSQPLGPGNSDSSRDSQFHNVAVSPVVNQSATNYPLMPPPDPESRQPAQATERGFVPDGPGGPLVAPFNQMPSTKEHPAVPPLEAHFPSQPGVIPFSATMKAWESHSITYAMVQNKWLFWQMRDAYLITGNNPNFIGQHLQEILQHTSSPRLKAALLACCSSSGGTPVFDRGQMERLLLNPTELETRVLKILSGNMPQHSPPVKEASGYYSSLAAKACTLYEKNRQATLNTSSTFHTLSFSPETFAFASPNTLVGAIFLIAKREWG